VASSRSTAARSTGLAGTKTLPRETGTIVESRTMKINPRAAQRRIVSSDVRAGFSPDPVSS